MCNHLESRAIAYIPSITKVVECAADPGPRPALCPHLGKYAQGGNVLISLNLLKIPGVLE